MAGDFNTGQEPKKNFPTSFFLFLIFAILIVVVVQNYVGSKMAKVSFSYQLEQLVNLDLIEPQDSRKIALNDNLVTFSGRFREHETAEGKKRYQFLELLNQHYQLVAQQTALENEMTQQSRSMKEAADWFLHIAGIPLPKGGYVIVDSSLDTQDHLNQVVLTQLQPRTLPNLATLASELGKATQDTISPLFDDVVTLCQAYRSPILGIGDETLKMQLKTLASQLSQSKSAEDRLSASKAAISQLQGITDKLNQEEQGIRLTQLRSVRDYTQDITQQQTLQESIDQNSALLAKARTSVANVVWFFNNQQLSTRALEKQDPEVFSQWFNEGRSEWDSFNVNHGAIFRAPDQPLNLVLEKTFKSEEPSPNYLSYLLTILPVLLVVFLLYFVFSRQMKGIGGSTMTFGKSPAKLLNKGSNKITFKDVAGIDEAKEELEEIVDFLKNPGKFTALGARLPKGVLCIGPPGTGKTLLAKAVAGEADRPFFSISGSDFVEMFVGVGASRIRDMFEQAKKNAPCLIFIDEIDAVGRHRGGGYGGGHDEREQTLNQLLVEMDGFDTNEGVILMAATNRPDVLDKALLRPGRFDRRVVIDLPDIKGRFEILQVHAKKIKLDPSVDLMLIARATPGSSGADLMNMLNEAALLAARRGRSLVSSQDALEATDKVLYGKERRSMELGEVEKRSTAYHESGHAVVGLIVKKSDPVNKVTIIPRGLSLGATHFLPEKNKVGYWREELYDRLAVAMGGRCAEEIFLNDMSSGASNDIQRATHMATSMVCEWGMSELMGVVAYESGSSNGQYVGFGSNEKNYSEETAHRIDEEVHRILTEAYTRAKNIILEHRQQVEQMTAMLMEFETLDAQDVRKIMDGTFTAEEKRASLKIQEEAHKKEVASAATTLAASSTTTPPPAAAPQQPFSDQPK